MKSVYREARWAKLQEKKEAGELVSYDFIGKQGEVSYRFIKNKQALQMMFNIMIFPHIEVQVDLVLNGAMTDRNWN